MTMTRGTDTKQNILEIGLDLASRLGLEAVSIGELAKASDMSKSGLFAHFQSKENLQIALLAHAAELFSRTVVVPALKTEAGIPRIKALVDHWIRYSQTLTGGCIFVTASTEFKDRPGKVRDLLLKQQGGWIDCLRRIARSAVSAGDFRNDTDCDQFAFEFYSLLLGFHLYSTLLGSADTQARQQTALETLIRTYRKPATTQTAG
jgi:AcrR family transcriptional regulator